MRYCIPLILLLGGCYPPTVPAPDAGIGDASSSDATACNVSTREACDRYAAAACARQAECCAGESCEAMTDCVAAFACEALLPGRVYCDARIAQCETEIALLSCEGLTAPAVCNGLTGP